MNEKRIVSVAVTLAILSMFLIATPQQAKATFILASWTYPDEYGQGIVSFSCYTNVTGSWVVVGEAGRNYLSASNVIDWNASEFIKLYVTASLNKTLIGLNSTALGRNYIRHNITVTDQFGAEVFSAENFTYYSVSYDSEYAVDLYYYVHTIILDFEPLIAEYYTAIMTCEIFY